MNYEQQYKRYWSISVIISIDLSGANIIVRAFSNNRKNKKCRRRQKIKRNTE